MDKKRSFFLLTSLFGILFIFSCDGIFPSQSKPDVPADHTRDISGVLHKPGLDNPLHAVNGCMTAACHGNDLRGGTAVSSGQYVVVPSCYQCHGALWENGGEDGEREGHDD